MPVQRIVLRDIEQSWLSSGFVGTSPCSNDRLLVSLGNESHKSPEAAGEGF